jgi:hypothetical protein
MKHFLFLLLVATALFSCHKTETLDTPNINDYYPLAIGKWVVYDMDSTVFLNFGNPNNVTIHHYQAKDSIDAEITDNLGRRAFRILRFIRSSSTDEWQPNNTFMAVPSGNTIELIENNIRYQKLKMPITQNFSWKGNSFIDISIYSDVRYLEDWDYTYDSINYPLVLPTTTVDSTIKVLQRDEYLGGDVTDPLTLYAEKNFSEEKYAKGIGLVSREFMHWIYQGDSGTGTAPHYDETSYGIKLTMIDHN